MNLKSQFYFADMKKSFNVILLFAFCAILISLSHAQDNGSKYRIGYKEGLLTIFAKEANLKKVLGRVAEEADILIRFPQDLSKRITIELSNVPIRKALRRLLRGENYAFVYEGADISEVYVVPESTVRTRSRNDDRSRQMEDRIRASIGRYEKRLEALKGRMAQVDKSSRRGKVIMRQIRSAEKAIERLNKRLE